MKWVTRLIYTDTMSATPLEPGWWAVPVYRFLWGQRSRAYWIYKNKLQLWSWTTEEYSLFSTLQ